MNTSRIYCIFLKNFFFHFNPSCAFIAALEIIGLKPITEILAEFSGGWPIALSADAWNESAFDWKRFTALALRTYSLDYILDIGNDLDIKNTEQSSIYVIYVQYFYVHYIYMFM